MDDIHKQLAALNVNIESIMGRKILAAVALCHLYAGLSLQAFRVAQAQDEFWTNQTNMAYNTVFSGVVLTEQFVGFYLAHLMEYGVYLEMANNRLHESLRPIVTGLVDKFVEDVKKTFGDDL